MRQSKKVAMYNLVQDWESSNQSKSDFCKSAAINIHTFTYWHQKYKKEIKKDAVPFQGSQGQNFLPLQVDKYSVVASAITIDFHYPNGVRLSVPQSVGISYLTQLLQIPV